MRLFFAEQYCFMHLLRQQCRQEHCPEEGCVVLLVETERGAEGNRSRNCDDSVTVHLSSSWSPNCRVSGGWEGGGATLCPVWPSGMVPPSDCRRGDKRVCVQPIRSEGLSLQRVCYSFSSAGPGIYPKQMLRALCRGPGREPNSTYLHNYLHGNPDACSLSPPSLSLSPSPSRSLLPSSLFLSLSIPFFPLLSSSNWLCFFILLKDCWEL